MNEQSDTPAAEAPARPGQLARIECGCGFLVEGWDEQINSTAFADHVCFEVSSTGVYRWYDGIFSFWGLCIAFVVAWAVVSVVLGKVVE